MPAAASSRCASDRDLTHNGVEVDLLGHRARMAKGPAVLVADDRARRSTAASIHYEPAPAGEGLGGHRTVIEFSDRCGRASRARQRRGQDLIQQCADHLAATIREHTSSWHMLQKVFVDDLDPAALDSRPPSSHAGHPRRSAP